MRSEVESRLDTSVASSALAAAAERDPILEVAGLSAADILKRCDEIRRHGRPARGVSVARPAMTIDPVRRRTAGACSISPTSATQTSSRQAHRVLLGRSPSPGRDEPPPTRPTRSLVADGADRSCGSRSRRRAARSRRAVRGIGLRRSPSLGRAVEAAKQTSRAVACQRAVRAARAIGSLGSSPDEGLGAAGDGRGGRAAAVAVDPTSSARSARGRDPRRRRRNAVRLYYWIHHTGAVRPEHRRAARCPQSRDRARWRRARARPCPLVSGTGGDRPRRGRAGSPGSPASKGPRFPAAARGGHADSLASADAGRLDGSWLVLPEVPHVGGRRGAVAAGRLRLRALLRSSHRGGLLRPDSPAPAGLRANRGGARALRPLARRRRPRDARSPTTPPPTCGVVGGAGLRAEEAAARASRALSPPRSSGSDASSTAMSPSGRFASPRWAPSSRARTRSR